MAIAWDDFALDDAVRVGLKENADVESSYAAFWVQ